MTRRPKAAAAALAVWVVIAGCAPDDVSVSSEASDIASYTETFDEAPEGFPQGTHNGGSTGVADGAYIVALTSPGTEHRTMLPVAQRGEGLLRIEADVEATPDGPLYGLGCWTGEAEGALLGLVQVTDGRAAAGIAHEDASGSWTPLEKADEGPTARVTGSHTLRLDCTRTGDGGTVTLTIDDEPLAAVEVAEPPDAGGALLYTHFSGTPQGSTAEMRFHEVRVNPRG